MATNLSSSVASLPNLEPGSTDSASVRALQQALVNAGYMTQAQMNTGPGIYGPQTTAAVAAWQSANGIPTNGYSGYFGPASKSFITSGSTSSSSNTTPTYTQPVASTPAVTQPTNTYVPPTTNTSSNNQPSYTPSTATTPIANTPGVTSPKWIYYVSDRGSLFWAGPNDPVSTIDNPRVISRDEFVKLSAAKGQGVPDDPYYTQQQPAKNTSSPSNSDLHFVMGRYGSSEVWTTAMLSNPAYGGTEIPYDQWMANPQKSINSGLAGVDAFIANKGVMPASASTTTPSAVSGSYPTVTLQPGSTDSSSVRQLQQALVRDGYMTQAQMDTGPGIYGPQTTAAVQKLQEKLGVNNASGVGYYGPLTTSAVTKALSTSPSTSTQTQTTPQTNVPTETGTTSPISATTPKTSDIPAGSYPIYGNGSAVPNYAGEQPVAYRDQYGVTRPIVTTLPPGLTVNGLENSAITQLPPEALSGVVPQLTPGTPEYQSAMDKIENAYFDVMQQQMSASTEQQHQAAQYSWNTLKSYIEKNFNTKLSENAFAAWDQFQNIQNQYSTQGISGSGIENESVDDYLKKVRRSDAATRSQGQTDQEKANMEFYQKYATPQQIADLIAKDPTKATAWGLVPSVAIKDALNPAALKAKYPNMSDQDIQAAIASVMDENGNYRSSLYQKYMTGSNSNIDSAKVTTTTDQYGRPSNVLVTPGDTGILDIKKAKQTDKEEQVNLQNILAKIKYDAALGATPKTTPADQASATSAGSLFNKDVNTNPGTTGNTTSAPLPNGAATTTNPLGIFGTNNASNPGLQAAANAAANLGSNPAPTTPAAPTPAAPTPSAPAPTAPTTPKKTYTTLYDYYTANGGWNTWNSAQRTADAKAAGLQNYTGEGSQNDKLLAYLNGK